MGKNESWLLMRAAMFVVGMVFLAGPLAAQSAGPMPPHYGRPPCHGAAHIAQQLDEQYQEILDANGAQSDGRVLKIYVGPYGSWTAVVVDQHERGCIVAAGQHWREVRPPLPDHASVSPMRGGSVAADVDRTPRLSGWTASVSGSTPDLRIFAGERP